MSLKSTLENALHHANRFKVTVYVCNSDERKNLDLAGNDGWFYTSRYVRATQHGDLYTVVPSSYVRQ